MKNSIFIFFLAISLHTFSQEDSLQVDTKKVSFGISYSPNYSYRVQVDDGTTMYSDVLYLGKDSEIGQFGHTINFDFRVFLAKQHKLNIGLQVSNEGYKAVNDNLKFGDVIDPRRGFVYPTAGISGLTFNYKFHYGGLNIGLKSSYGNKAVRFNHAIGIVPKFLISGSAIGELSVENQPTSTIDFRKTNDFNRFNLEGYISVGGEWEFKKNRIIEFAPTFRYNLIKTSDDSFTSNLWNIGVRLGFFI